MADIFGDITPMASPEQVTLDRRRALEAEELDRYYKLQERNLDNQIGRSSSDIAFQTQANQQDAQARVNEAMAVESPEQKKARLGQAISSRMNQNPAFRTMTEREREEAYYRIGAEEADKLGMQGVATQFAKQYVDNVTARVKADREADKLTADINKVKTDTLKNQQEVRSYVDPETGHKMEQKVNIVSGEVQAPYIKEMGKPYSVNLGDGNFQLYDAAGKPLEDTPVLNKVEAEAELGRIVRARTRFDQFDNELRKIEAAMGNIEGSGNFYSGWFTTGLGGSMLKHIPSPGGLEIDARNLATQLDSIKSVLSSSSLQKMRDEAANGASGWGQISIRELDMLESQIAKLDQGLSPQGLKDQLNIVAKHYTNLKNSMTRDIGFSDVDWGEEHMKQFRKEANGKTWIVVGDTLIGEYVEE